MVKNGSLVCIHGRQGSIFCELERIRPFEFGDLDSGSGKGSMVERCLDCVQLAIHRVEKVLEIKTAAMAQRIVHERICVFRKEIVNACPGVV